MVSLISTCLRYRHKESRHLTATPFNIITILRSIMVLYAPKPITKHVDLSSIVVFASGSHTGPEIAKWELFGRDF